MSSACKEYLEELIKMEEAVKAKDMCLYCDSDSDKNSIWMDCLTGDWYLQLETTEWDPYEGSYTTIREYINYCPYCGRKLK